MEALVPAGRAQKVVGDLGEPGEGYEALEVVRDIESSWTHFLRVFLREELLGAQDKSVE